MKQCNRCQIEKEEFEFHKKGNSHQSMCKDCRKIYIGQYYLSNKKKFADSSRTTRLKRAQEWKEFKSTLSCKECGEDHPACLDFHHRDSEEKRFNLAKGFVLAARSKVLDEIKKCDILCANCHRKLHHPA